jgi:hypothetical protein
MSVDVSGKNMTSDVVGISQGYGVSNMQIHKYKSHTSFLLTWVKDPRNPLNIMLPSAFPQDDASRKSKTLVYHTAA